MSNNIDTGTQVIHIQHIATVPSLTLTDNSQNASSLLSPPLVPQGVLYWDADVAKIAASTVDIKKLEAFLKCIQIKDDEIIIANNVTALSYNAVDLV